MELQTPDPVVVTAYGLWQDDQPQMGHFIEVADPDNPEAKFRYSVDKEAKIDVPPIGTAVTLLIRFFIRPEARVARSGKAYIANLEKRRVVALRAA